MDHNPKVHNLSSRVISFLMLLLALLFGSFVGWGSPQIAAAQTQPQPTTADPLPGAQPAITADPLPGAQPQPTTTVAPASTPTIATLVSDLGLECSQTVQSGNVTELQLPDLPANYVCIDGASAWSQGHNINSLWLRLFPNKSVGLLEKGVNLLGDCAQSEGIANWNLYINAYEPRLMGAMAVVSKDRLGDPTSALISCGGDRFASIFNEVIGAGPGSLALCHDSYAYDTYVYDTYSGTNLPLDTYYVLLIGTEIGGTSTSVCGLMTTQQTLKRDPALTSGPYEFLPLWLNF